MLSFALPGGGGGTMPGVNGEALGALQGRPDHKVLLTNSHTHSKCNGITWYGAGQ